MLSKEDILLEKKIKGEIDRFLTDQHQAKPRFKPKDIPAEIHGYLADLLFIDHVQNEALVGFIISLLYEMQKRTDKDIIDLLADISNVLGSSVAHNEKLMNETKEEL